MAVVTGPEPGERAARTGATFEACNTGTATGMAAHFTDGSVIHDTNHAPVRTAADVDVDVDRVGVEGVGVGRGDATAPVSVSISR